jgi:hypothetical protein
MLGNPISALSAELIDDIVDWAASLLGPGILALLSADRAFGPRCRMHLYKLVVFNVGRSWRLPKFRALVETNSSILPYIQGILICFATPEDLWTEPNPHFEYITQALAKNSHPPTSLEIRGPANLLVGGDEPHSFHRWLSASFFPSTLRQLDLACVDGLLPQAIRQCRALESLKVAAVGITKSTSTVFPENDGDPLPHLKVLDCANSYRLLRKIVAPRSPSSAFVSLEALEVLKLCPDVKKEIPMIQPILDGARSTLQELHLTNFVRTERTFFSPTPQRL